MGEIGCGGSPDRPSAFFKGEVIPRLFSEKGAFSKSSARNLVRNPEVAGSAAVEVDGVFDMKPFKGLGLEVVGKTLERCAVGMANPKVVSTIPDDEGSRTFFRF